MHCHAVPSLIAVPAHFKWCAVDPKLNKYNAGNRIEGSGSMLTLQKTKNKKSYENLKTEQNCDLN